MPQGSRPPPDPLYVLRAHGADVTAVCFLHNDLYLASGDVEGKVIIWSMTTRRPVQKWQAHTSGILAVHQIPGDRLLSHGRDDQLHIWDLSKLGSETTDVGVLLPEFTLLVNSLNFCGAAVLLMPATAETLVALPGIDENAAIDIYNLTRKEYHRQGLMVSNAAKDTGLCMCLRVFHDQSGEVLLAAGYESGVVIIWDVQSGEARQSGKLHEEPVLSLDIAPDASMGVAGGADTKIVRWRLDTASETRNAALEVLGEQTLPARGTAAVRIRPDGKIVATGSWDSSIRIFSAKTLKPLAVLQAHRQNINCLCFAGEGRTAETKMTTTPANMLAVGSKDGSITLWSIY
ncbi:Guanine nucleotide binding protein (G protein), beta polypeptide 1-like [Geranomyces variabilis]|nr:Guanine nucleotide binding protein (G protein), beta polypeptide 1-like [Geranomyces variabilis]